jgi:hypothetical protein
MYSASNGTNGTNPSQQQEEGVFELELNTVIQNFYVSFLVLSFVAVPLFSWIWYTYRSRVEQVVKKVFVGCLFASTVVMALNMVTIVTSNSINLSKIINEESPQYSGAELFFFTLFRVINNALSNASQDLIMTNGFVATVALMNIVSKALTLDYTRLQLSSEKAEKLRKAVKGTVIGFVIAQWIVWLYIVGVITGFIFGTSYASGRQEASNIIATITPLITLGNAFKIIIYLASAGGLLTAVSLFYYSYLRFPIDESVSDSDEKEKDRRNKVVQMFTLGGLLLAAALTFIVTEFCEVYYAPFDALGGSVIFIVQRLGIVVSNFALIFTYGPLDASFSVVDKVDTIKRKAHEATTKGTKQEMEEVKIDGE